MPCQQILATARGATGFVLLVALVLSAVGDAHATAPGSPATQPSVTRSGLPLGGYEHLVVIYEENHSFDNLFGSWERVDGLPRRAVAQVDMRGKRLSCLPQNDVNLT